MYRHYAADRQALHDWAAEMELAAWKVEPFNVKETREGIAKALNNLVSEACLNEH
jgi:DnaJ-domain-containing protein 1